MNHLIIINTKQVLLWRRLAAQAIDCVLIYLAVIVLAIWVRPAEVLFDWMLLWTYLVYSILMDAYREGTVGKLYLGLKVVKANDGSSKLLAATYRNFMKLLITLFLYDIFLLISRKGYSGFHNRVAKTMVVEVPR